MAVTQNTIIGRARGSVGNITFTTLRGLNIMKSKAQNAYSDPNEEQLAQNHKFSVVMFFQRSIALFVRAGFPKPPIGLTSFNFWQKSNPYSQIVVGEGNDMKINTQTLTLSKGTMLLASSFTKAASGANAITVTWDDSLDSQIPSSSKVYIAALNRSTGLVRFMSNLTEWNTSNATITDTGIGTAIATTDIYVFVQHPSSGDVTDSKLAL